MVIPAWMLSASAVGVSRATILDPEMTSQGVPAGLRVQPGGQLVKHGGTRVADERRRDGQALL
jgi:hypothetical protein